MRNSVVSSQTSLRHPVPTARLPVSAVLVDVVVLSSDPVLFEAIRNAVGERNPVWRARSAEESVDLLLTGRCGVLVVDMGAVSTDRTTLIEQIVAQFPDVVVVVAGRREDESLVARLISEGLIYRFMHKPLSAKRAGMFLGASIRHHVERRGQRIPESLLPKTAGLPPLLTPRMWLLVAAGLCLFVGLFAAWLGGFGQGAAPRSAAPMQRPDAAATQSTLSKTDPVLSRARAALAGGRYESPPGRNALDLYAAVLLARPGHHEARAGLDETVVRIVQQADRAAAAGRKEEARRLLQRLQSVDPRRDAVAALAARLEPPPAPSQVPATAVPLPDVARDAPPGVVVALPPAKPTVAAVPPPTPTPTATVAVPPPTRAPATSPAKPVVVPDPLTPRIVNAAALRERTAPAANRNSSAAAFGPPISSGHPIAGYAKPAAQTERPPVPAPAEIPAAESVVSSGPPLPVDEFQPVAVTDPVYPPQALRNRVEGWVTLEFTITETGVVRDVEVIEAEPRDVFDKAAAEALGTWRFRPRFANGRPVPQRSVVTLRFNVDG